jgi:hypothetical protein
VSNAILDFGKKLVKQGKEDERTRILQEIDQLIHDTEDCPLYEGEEREWLLSAYWNVRRLVNGTNQDLPRHLDKDISPGKAKATGVEGD